MRLPCAIRPEKCEFIWAEPYNDRDNWRVVQAGYEANTPEHDWFDRAFGTEKDPELWSEYASRLYKALRMRAEAEGWIENLRFMLYEASVSESSARSYHDLRGILLQSLDDDGRSKHPEFAKLQDKAKLTIWDHIQNPYEDRVPDPEPAMLREHAWASCVGAANPCAVELANCTG